MTEKNYPTKSIEVYCVYCGRKIEVLAEDENVDYFCSDNCREDYEYFKNAEA